MKKLILSILAISLLALLYAPSAGALNNFTITSYDIDMTLGRDNDRRSTLSVKETVTANFSTPNENHGLERAFVKNYDGHSLSFTLESVTDEHGVALRHSWSGDNLRIGDPDAYVYGEKTYVISYTMRDVTRFFRDSQRDEFYWDVLGVEWRVPIQTARVNLTIDPALRGAMTGDVTCYTGAFRSTDRCEVKQTETGLFTSVQGLSPHTGVTIAVGFQAETFVAHERSLLETLVMIWVIIQIIAAPLGIGFLIFFLARWYGRLNRKKELGTIVPEYIPPANTSVMTASRLDRLYRSMAMTAQMLDLAVRHYVKIYEVQAKRIFVPAEYEIEVTRDPNELPEEEQEILSDMFGQLPTVGRRLNLKELQNNTVYYMRTLDNDQKLDDLVRTQYGLWAMDYDTRNWGKKWSKVAIIGAIVLLSPLWLFVAIVLFVAAAKSWRLTDKGLELKRYLAGLKLYISVAETERLKMMQSPDGAEKVRQFIDGDPSADPKLLVKLYERVLPYAVLFGQEKQWNAQLGRYYETAGNSPDWYSGQTAFNAAVFSSAMSSFSQASMSVSSYSSSSSGSSGGGFSGGGGGGGGGGGW